MEAEIEAIVTRGEATLREAGVGFERIDHVVEFDMLYVGQTHTVAVPLPVTRGPDGWSLTPALIRDAFESAYRAAFGRLLDGIAMRVMNLRVAVIGRRPKFDLALLAPQSGGSVGDAVRETRPVWQDGAWADTRVYDRMALPVDARIDGPALLEQADTTIFVDADLMATVDRFGNLIIERAE